MAHGWDNSLGKKWISCLLSINVQPTAAHHKTAEGPVKKRGNASAGSREHQGNETKGKYWGEFGGGGGAAVMRERKKQE